MGNFKVGLNSVCIMVWSCAFGEQGVAWSGWIENVSHRLKKLIAWSSLDGALWKGSRGGA